MLPSPNEPLAPAPPNDPPPPAKPCGAELAKYWEDALHSLKGLPHVIDIRNLGLIGAVELEPIAGAPTKRAFSAFVKGFDAGILIRTTGDIIAMSPPLIIEKSHIDILIGKLAEILKGLE